MRMRWMVVGVSAALVSLLLQAVAHAEDRRETGDKVLNNVLSGLLGSQGPSYTEQERDRLVSMLQSGDYTTSRQGEPIDVIAYGIPLTHRDHVYTAKPIPPSRTSQP